MNDQVPTPESQPQAGNEDSGSLEAAALAFEKRDVVETQEANSEDQSAPEDEKQQDDSEEDLGDETPEDDTDPEAEYVEVQIDGKTFKVPPEVQKATLRHADYSRKMNEVTAKDKLVAQRIETVEALTATATKRAEVMAEAKALDAEIASYDSVDWGKAEAENPAGAAIAAVKLMRLQQQRAAIEQKSQGVEQEYQGERQKLIQTQRDEMDKTLAKDLKGWGDTLATDITKYALGNGWSREKLEQVTDPQVVIALNKARLFDALQSKKAEIKGQVKDVPQVVKPGAPRRADPRSDAMAKLRNTGSVDDAAAAFLSRMK